VLVGELTWRAQLPLAERWALAIVERAGYGRSRGRAYRRTGGEGARRSSPRQHAQLDAEGCGGRRPLELGAIAGQILNGGERHGIDVAATRELVDLILARTSV
jgi:hypothetical protein